MTWRSIFLLMLLCASSSLVLAALGEAAGPWRAQVVDADTGQPLEGVVVLAVWNKRTPGPGHPTITFYDAGEVVTDRDGRFLIPSRWTWTLIPFTSIEGPEIVIFKPSYGQWRVRNPEQSPQEQWEKHEEEPGNIFEEEGVVVELPSLKTREERLQFYFRFTWSALIPPKYTSRLREAKDKERAYLGFGR